MKRAQPKGYMIVDELSRAGLNNNSLNKLFEGTKRGRPNAEHRKHAEAFAQNLKQNLQDNKR